MLQTISLWLHGTTAGKLVLTALVSMVPVLELRAGLPAGVALGLPIPLALLASVLGNLFPVPFVILFIRRIFWWMREHSAALARLVDRIERRALGKLSRTSRLRYEAWGLLLFVAVPLPGTGAWTGALLAALLNLRLKNAFPVIALGVLIAGTIVTAITYGVTALL